MAQSMRCIFAILCLILQCIVFLFVIVATPVDAFRAKSEYLPGYRSCYSMWGLKRCGNHGTNYNNLAYKGFGCKSRRDNMNAAAAFAIFSIFVTLVAVVLTIVNLIGVLKTANIISLILGAVAFFTILVSWACMAGTYYKKCAGYKLSQSYNYAGAFGLMVTAWCLQLITCILLIFA